MVEIYGVEPGSAAERAGLRPGDCLISINGHEITDVLDYRFYLAEPQATLKIHRGPELFDVSIEKGEYDDIGLEFRTFLMDEKRTCRNKC
ncbi:MAG: PDZ domain-containing protein, partial [Eubacteriales bacterium]